MATITNREIIRQLLKNDGHFSDDPVPVSVWAFHSTLANRENWAIFCTPEHDMLTSVFVQNPVMLFCDGQLTDAGKRWLQANQQEETGDDHVGDRVERGCGAPGNPGR